MRLHLNLVWKDVQVFVRQKDYCGVPGRGTPHTKTKTVVRNGKFGKWQVIQLYLGPKFRTIAVRKTESLLQIIYTHTLMLKLCIHSRSRQSSMGHGNRARNRLRPKKKTKKDNLYSSSLTYDPSDSGLWVFPKSCGK